MRNLRSRLTYANVVATLALVLALGGGTVYAAIKLGKNDVKSKNIAKNAVKTSDLANNAVKSPKIKDGTIGAGDLAAGVIQADVTASSTGGPQGGINTNTTTPLPLTGTTTFTPGAGEVAAVAAEAEFTLAAVNAMNACSPAVRLFVNGQPTRVFVSPEESVTSTTPVSAVGRDADGPFGLLDPGTPVTVTAALQGRAECTANSQLDRVEVRILQIR
jgi:hypothetical protein